MKFTINDRISTSPHRPAVRAGVQRLHNGYHVPDVGISVEAWPHRSLSHARQLARRIFRDPRGYLAIINLYCVPGIVHTHTATRAA